MRQLYAVAVERYKGGNNWTADIVYLHADGQRDARVKFLAGEPKRKRVRVVAIGPVIGYNVDDKEGKQLSV
ncbi:MAG: hypothetical protein ACREBG_12415 [Pyrinomonadaceae bacterium]